MKPNFLLLLVGVLFMGKTARLNSQDWTAAERYSSPSNSLLANTSTALASDGSMYVVGNFRNMACFDTIILNAPLPNRTHGFLLKLDAQMQPLWAKQFPEYPYDVTVDAQDNVFLVGSRWNSVGSDDTLAYVAKYNSGGALLATFYSTGTAKTWSKVVRTDAAGNCYIAGERFSSGIATIGSFNLPGGSGRQCFIAKLNPNLSQVQWATFTGSSPNLDNVYDLEVDVVNGHIYASGNYSQQCGNIFCTYYNGDFYVEKHSLATGASVWKRVFSGGSGTSTKQFARLAPDGQTLSVIATFKNTTQFSPTISLSTNAVDADYHIYLAQISTADASLHWATKISTSGDSYLLRVARRNDNIWLCGQFQYQTTMGAFVLNPDSNDGFLTKTTADGSVMEAERIFGNGSEAGLGLALRDTIVGVTGISTSPSLHIGSFNLPGNNNTTFVARKGGLPQPPPIAGFTANVTSGCIPLMVQFSSTSLQSPTTFNWQFPGGFPGSSTVKNPTVSYSTPGTYAVTLIVKNGAGADTLVQSGFITVAASIPIATFSSMTNGLTTNFNNTSTNATSYHWDFGDGQMSNQDDPVHTYAACGTYTVILTCGNACSTASRTASITVGNGPPTSVCGSTPNGLEVYFSNASTNATTYFWDFGDGQISSEQNPVHSYANCGTYHVTLISTNLCGAASSTLSITLGNGDPTAAFNSMTNGLAVNFSNTSTNATTYLWDFGDGQSSVDQNPAHTYAECDTYTVTLTSTNLCGTASSTSTMTLGNGAPTAAFSSLTNGLAVIFSNASSNASTYLWDFGDGQSSMEQYPSHNYAECGTYSVTLTSANLCGTASSTSNVTIGNAIPGAAFNSTSDGLVVNFNNQSMNASGYLWDFGDGQTSTEVNPIHSYDDCGTYTVILTSINLCGTASSTSSMTLGNGDPTASFSSLTNGLEVTFSNASSNASTYLWDFGDGQSSIEQYPSHNYAECGTYSVTLTSTNLCGTAISTTNVTVGSGVPTAVYGSTSDGLVVNFINQSTNASDYLWDFGDGQTSTEVNPIHSYDDCGAYTVTLTSTNLCGTAISTTTVYATNFPEGSFTFFVNGLEVSFLNTSTGGISYFWDFGDGNTSTLQDPIPHTYADSGAYVVTLVVTNNCGATIYEQLVTIQNTVSTDTPEGVEGFRLYPNPSKGLINVDFKATLAGDIECTIFSPTGQLIHAEVLAAQNGFVSQQIDLGDVPPGAYLLRLRVGSNSWMYKVMVVR